MADAEQLAIIRRSVADWNAWREKNPDMLVDLSKAGLLGANLGGADLHRANLDEANLRGADLTKADLSYAYLLFANLNGVGLSGANLNRAGSETSRTVDESCAHKGSRSKCGYMTL